MIPSIDEKYHTKDELISAPWRYVDPSFSKPYNVLFLVQERRNMHDVDRTDVNYCELLKYKNFNKYKKITHNQMKWYEPKLCKLYNRYYPVIRKINTVIDRLTPWR